MLTGILSGTASAVYYPLTHLFKKKIIRWVLVRECVSEFQD